VRERLSVDSPVASGTIALFLPSLAGGGAERVFVELANEFAARGSRVDLVLASATGPFLPEVAPGVRVVDLGAARVSRALPRLARYLRTARPSAILSALDHANVIAILARLFARSGTRVVISVRSMPSQVYPGTGFGKGRFLPWLMRRTYRRADAIVANSRSVAVDVARLLGISVERVHVIYNPLNLNRIEQQSREPIAHDWLVEGAPPVVLAVGSLTSHKDFGTLIRAFAILRSHRPCRLVLLGDGPERQELESLAARLGVSGDILMPGFDLNPFAWMRRAKLFVSSSLTEGCPNALMQALAIGIPIVSTDSVGGAGELLEAGRWGRVVAVVSPEALAASMAERLESNANTDGRIRAADFAHERIASQYLEVLIPAEQRQ
jgi:glycosyltransferase involved in cell wall biosynthesis